ncbi:MAG: SprT family zinc-dependent metalloprotease [Cyanobacteria bacterium J06621_3]
MSQLKLFSVSDQDPHQSQFTDYRVRESKRAKHVSIKISLEGEVELVVPPRFDRRKLPEIVAKRQDWIEKTRARLERDRAETPKDWTVEKPNTILFRYRSHQLDSELKTADAETAIAKGFGQSSKPDTEPDTGSLETWEVAYQPTNSQKIICIPQSNNQLLIKGDTEHLPSCQAVLRKWLTQRAHQEIAPWLRQLSSSLDLPFHNISVRGQKTCWASCSGGKNISLNFKLMFLPRPLVHYVLVHELCHTIHMNHSKDFWALVEQKQHDYSWRRKAIKKAWRYVPRWVDA